MYPIRIVMTNPEIVEAYLGHIVSIDYVCDRMMVEFDDGVKGVYPTDYPYVFPVKEATGGV